MIKKAPIIIKKDMIGVIPNGSVIYDLAAIQGGNTELTKVDEIIESNGVKIIGEKNILNKLPVSEVGGLVKQLPVFLQYLVVIFEILGQIFLW